MARKAFKMVFYAALGGGGITTMYLAASEKKWAYVAHAEQLHNRHFADSPIYVGQPATKWVFDWDRDNGSKEKAVLDPIENTGKSIEKASKPVATRHLILVRHGQFNLKGELEKDRYLTPLGRQQAAVTGKRLKELGLTYTRLIHSTLTRADETAQIIHLHLKNVPIESTDLLREGAPYPPEPPIRSWNPPKKDFYEDGARIERAFRTYFHRAEPSQLEDSYEILVCHANVIRYFLVRALQLPPETWLRFTLHNCSLTWIKIRPSGRVGAYIIGDCGHMPPSLMTTS